MASIDTLAAYPKNLICAPTAKSMYRLLVRRDVLNGPM